MSLPRQNNPWKRLLDFDGNSFTFSSKQLSCALAIGPLSFFFHHLLMQSKVWAKLPQDTPSLSLSLSRCASRFLGVPFLSTTGLVVGLWVDSSAFLSFSSLLVAFKGHLFDGPFSLIVVSTGCTSLKMSSSVQGSIRKKKRRRRKFPACVSSTHQRYKAGCDNRKKGGKIKDILLVGAKNAFEFSEKRDIQLRRKTKCHCENLMLLDHKTYGPNNFSHTIGFLNIFFSHFLS